ncbi:MAG: redoxin domain-containing protein [Blastocatellia bacterium]|nr:redoxin domain-containing protein [Blastocatellia bacterium]
MQSYRLVALIIVLFCTTTVFAQKRSVKKHTENQSQEKSQKSETKSEWDLFREASQITDPKEKLSSMKKFAETFPESTLIPLVKIQLLKATAETGGDEKSLTELAEDAVKGFPTGTQRVYVLNEIAYSLVKAGKAIDLAIKYSQEAVDKFPAEADSDKRALANHTLGLGYLKRNSYTEAIKYLDIAAKLGDYPSIYENLAEAYEKAGQGDKAVDALATAMITSGNSELASRREATLKAAYAKLHKSEEGFDKFIAERKEALFRDRALVQKKYEAPASDWTLPAIAGEQIKSTDFKGKVVVLNWWGSWCPPCQHELPHFQTLYEKYKDKGVVFVGMNWERPGPAKEARIEKAKAFLTAKNLSFPVALDLDMAVGTDYSVQAFPTLFVIDKTGRIKYKITGYSDEVPKMLELQIETELSK